MPLDWLNTPLDADLGDLIARKRRAKTIDLLRSQLQGRLVPPVQMRLQLADLLVQSGRDAEAVPVLIGLADEFAGDGFVAKAIAILKRVEKVQPGRGDVESRLAALVKLQRAAPAARPRARRLPEFGMEEITEITPEPESSPEPESPLQVSPDPAAVVDPQPAAAAADDAVLPAPPAETDASRRVRGVFRRFLESLPGNAARTEPPPRAEAPVIGIATGADEGAASDEDTVPDAGPPETITLDATAPDVDATTPDAIAPAATSGAAMPTAAAPANAATPVAATPDVAMPTAAAPETPRAEPSDVPHAAGAPSPSAQPPRGADTQGVAGRIRGAFRWLVASLAAAPEETGAQPPAAAPAGTASPATESAAPPESATAPAAAEPAPAQAENEEVMSDEVFQERVLDLVQDILRRPDSGRVPGAAPPMDRRLVLRYAQRLLATALFGDLSEEELLAVVRGLRLHLHGPGDVLVTEGERGQSVFVLVAGAAKVFVRSPAGRNFPVAELREGDFFGEISSLSGRPRSATVTAAARCELLELDRPTLDQIARTHPRVADVLEEFYIQRASSPEAAAIRAVPLNDPGAERKAIEVLEAHFGQSRWDPRMRLRLADVLLKAGKYQDAVPVLIGLADDLARAGFPDKAIAVLKKIEKIQRRNIEVVNLAPLARGGPAPAAPPPRAQGPAAQDVSAKTRWGPQPTAEFFQGWILDVLRDRVPRSEPADGSRTEAEQRSALGSIRGYGPGLLASPLFEDFTDDELLAVIRGLRLLTFETGDIIITEGEPGQSLFVLTTGTVKVFVRDPAGRSIALCPLGEGAFFGEIATLSGRPRSATVTAASRCELLELDKPALEAILQVHPRVRDVLEEHYIARANDPDAAAIRGTPLDDPARRGTS